MEDEALVGIEHVQAGPQIESIHPLRPEGVIVTQGIRVGIGERAAFCPR
jgi:hypothetical protein